jgi:hypothetical protein
MRPAKASSGKPMPMRSWSALTVSDVVSAEVSTAVPFR